MRIQEASQAHARQAYTKRDEPGQTVYVFGAGASATEGNIPTNANLLQRSLEAPGLSKEDQRRLTKFLERVYKRSFVRDHEWPTFEEVFTFVKLALESEKYFRGWERSSLVEIRNLLLLGANLAITENQPRIPINHHYFIRNLFTNHYVNNANTGFLSFNYDIMLDRALVARQDLVGDVDYGVYFRSFDIRYKRESSQWKPPRPGKELFLLKLHGSFNWTWCPVCSFARIYPKVNVSLSALRSEKICAKCEGPVESIIVPPSSLKNYGNPDIASIWSIAEFLLSQAEMIVFIGSSFSDADIEFKFLLRRALSVGNSSKKVVVVTRPQQETSKDSDEYRRYRRFFGEVNWQAVGFEKFAKAPLHAAS